MTVFSKKIFNHAVTLAVFDFLLFNLSYFLSNFIKRGTFVLDPKYGKLLLLFYLCWLFSFLATKKYNTNRYSSYGAGLAIFSKSTLYLGYCVAFLVVILGVPAFSRLQIFMTCAGLLILETILWSLVCRKKIKLSFLSTRSEPLFSVSSLVQYNKGASFLFWTDLACLFVGFFAVNYLKRNTFVLLPAYDQLLIIIFSCWAISAFVIRKFRPYAKTDFLFALWQWLKAIFFMVALISVAVYGFRLFQFSRFQAYGTVGALLCLEIILLRVYFLWRKDEQETDIESPDRVRQLLNQEELDIDIDHEQIRKILLESVRAKLKDNLCPENKTLFDFIDAHVDLDQILSLETVSEINGNIFSVTSERLPVRMMLMPYKINNIRRLNKYFLKVHQTLLPGGTFIGHAHTISTRREWVYSRFPENVVRYVYFLDFCFTRVMPKLPVLHKLYFALTKGKNRVISRSEILGRLCFCGFEIVADQNIKNRFYFIAKKAKTPAIDPSPTYGPLVELKRVGFKNEIMHTYKFRTMHPYSEYLQQYMVDLQGLQKGGKIENDFRLTSWGKIMRKLWIDELPMLYNWAKGDMQIVGVRPLSVQYFNMYDDELKNLRKKVRPGLVPPFYADLPETFEEICESEKRYIRSYLIHPIQTQVKYFWKAFVNIVIKGARSK